MVAFTLVLSLALCTWPATQALRVTPTSTCAQICMGDPSDSSLASTTGSDIVCKDDDYARSAEGQRFKDCVNCLQNSTVAGSGESDQAWWLYNLRFAVNTCLFNIADATDPISTSCSTDSVCGPISAALQDGMGDPSTMHEFSYCTFDYNSFRGRYLQTCTTCLRESANQVYLSNFLVALNAGCIQQPPAGVLIGVNSTLFTKNTVTITSPMTSPPQPPKPHKPLSKGAVIAIAVVCGVAGLVIIALVFMCTRRHINEKRLKHLQSPLDARFGAPNISAPHSNAYASPESPPLVKEAIAMSGSPPMTNTSRHGSVGTVIEIGDQNSPGYSPPPFGVSIPTHHAYVPPQYTPRSRSSLSPKYGSLPPSLQNLPSAPYPDRSLSPTNSTPTSAGRTPPPIPPPPPASSPPPVPTPSSLASPQYVPSPSSIPSPGEIPQPSPAVSTPSSTSSFSLNRILNRTSHGSGEPFLPRFSLSQRSFGRGHTGTRRDARSAFQISGPIINPGNGNTLGTHAPSAPSSRPNNRRRRSISSTDSDPLW